MRWLPSAYHSLGEVAQAERQEQLAIAVGEADAALLALPKEVGAQLVALGVALARAGRAGPADLARQFKGARPARLAPMLKAVAALGPVREAGGGRYVA